MSPGILVAGIGNIFLGDDAFGVEVVRSLGKRQLPRHVLVKDFGIRGLDLAYALLDPWDAVVLVDALARGSAPGTLYKLEPDLAAIGSPSSLSDMINPHGLDPVRVLQLAASLGGINAPILVIGCEPQDFGDELEGRIGLTPAVEAAVDRASCMIEELVKEIVSKAAVA